MSSNPFRRKATATDQHLPGRLALTLGRALDPVLGYALLRHGVAGKVLQTVGFKRIITLPLVTRVGLNSDFIGAGLLDKPGNMLLTMGAIHAFRHIWWANAEADCQLPLSSASIIAGINSAYTIINSLVFVYRVSRGHTNPLASGWMQYLGFLLVVAGNVGEIVAEKGRRAFKKDPKNKGKIYDQGAFGVVRHPNYAYYTLSHVGYALATGSIWNVALTAAAQIAGFAYYSIPEISGHMETKYSTEWKSYISKVPYALIPYVY